MKPVDNLPFISSLSAVTLEEAKVKLIPYPQDVSWINKKVEIRNLHLIPSKELSELLAKEVKRITAILGINLVESSNYLLTFSLDSSLANEGYRLTGGKESMDISASTEAGYYYGLQTLSQLITSENGTPTIQLVEINDWPAYAIRGYMIDVGRNFQSIEVLKEQLDIMARYKINVFQWHLTDGPAWRIQSHHYPELTASENHLASRDPGKFYTYAEIRELIAYADQRKITIIPEIDMPGHSESFRKAMGFAMKSEKGMEDLEIILAEFFEETPKKLLPMIHIGSDEIHISNAEEFIDRRITFVEKNDRKAIIWAPGLIAKIV
jgi:N-acetyl-beta-hexosaminidase